MRDILFSYWGCGKFFIHNIKATCVALASARPVDVQTSSLELLVHTIAACHLYTYWLLSIQHGHPSPWCRLQNCYSLLIPVAIFVLGIVVKSITSNNRANKILRKLEGEEVGISTEE